jgi:hypothetical protein
LMAMTDTAEPAGTRALTAMREQALGALFDEGGIERPIEPASRLAQEVAACGHDVARHFLGELPKHCTLLATAVADALGSLARLDRELPFAAVVVVRGLLECAADLYWLSDPAIDSTERTRRTFLVYLRQHETVVRQLVQLSARVPPAALKIPDLLKAIAEGWESLKLTAEEMATAGYPLRTSKKPGSKYVLGKAKPSTSALIDRLIKDQLGTTALNLYTGYSPVAHGEGEGLGSLLIADSSVETPEGIRYERGFDAPTWKERIVAPALAGAIGSVGAWVELAFPSRAAALRIELRRIRSQVG